MTHRLKILVTLVASLTLTGCFAGRGVRLTRQPYNEAVQYTAKQQMLLNLVRTKYREPVQFIGLPNITEGLSYGSSGGWSFSPHRLTDWNFGASASESPTLSYQVLESDEFHRRMMAPIRKDVVDLLKNSASTSQVMRTVVKNINDVDNASSAGGPTPEMAPEFLEFKIAIHALEELGDIRQAEFAMISEPEANAATEDKETRLTTETEIEREIQQEIEEGIQQEFAKQSKDNIDARIKAAIKAAIPPVDGKDSEQEDIQAETLPASLESALKQPFRLDVTHRESDSLAPVEPEEDKQAIRFANEAFDSQELQTIQQVFRLCALGPGDPFYEFRLGDFGTLRRRGGIQKHMWVQTRSFMEVLHFLSQGICIPQEHYDEGLVTCTRNYDGSVFDWRQVTGDLLQVCVSDCKPEDASTAIRYNGYWYYIRDNDLRSKSTFNLLIELYNIAVRGGAVANAPALTIGV